MGQNIPKPFDVVCECSLSGNRVDGNHGNVRTPIQSTFFYARFSIKQSMSQHKCIYCEKRKVGITAKGQLISKCLVGIFNISKKQTKNST